MHSSTARLRNYSSPAQTILYPTFRCHTTRSKALRLSFIILHETTSSTPPSRPQNPPSHLPSSLSTCTRVFVRDDALQKLFEPPYDGPYKIIRRAEIDYTLEINDKTLLQSNLRKSDSLKSDIL